MNLNTLPPPLFKIFSGLLIDLIVWTLYCLKKKKYNNINT